MSEGALTPQPRTAAIRARRLTVDVRALATGAAVAALLIVLGASNGVEREAYPSLLASAHALVLLQRKVAANVNLPSKIASYLASGRPVVASIGLDTLAAKMLDESGGALVVSPEDPDALAQAMRTLSDDSELRADLGARGRAYAVEHLAKETVLPKLERAFLGS